MKRTPLARRTPLRAKAPMRRGRAFVRVKRSTGPTPEQRLTVAARARHACEKCGALAARAGGQVHHRDPRRSGGSSRPEINSLVNLLLLCVTCHAHVESYRTEAYENGWLVKSGIDPATVPVKLHDHAEPVFLEPDGTYREVEA